MGESLPGWILHWNNRLRTRLVTIFTESGMSNTTNQGAVAVRNGWQRGGNL